MVSKKATIICINPNLSEKIISRLEKLEYEDMIVFPSWEEFANSYHIKEKSLILFDLSDSNVSQVQEIIKILNHDLIQNTIFIVSVDMKAILLDKGLINNENYLLNDFTSRELELVIEIITRRQKNNKTSNSNKNTRKLSLSRQEIAELIDNELLYRTLFELSPNGILIGNSKGEILSVNPYVCDLFGYTKEEFLQMRFHDLTEDPTKSIVDNNIQRILAGEFLHNEVCNKRKDGSKIYVDIREKRINLPDGEFGILVVSSDITGRKRIENELLESEEKYRILVEKANDGIIFIQNGKLVFGNSKIMDIVGQSPSSFYGKSFSSFLHPSETNRIMDFYYKRLQGISIPSTYESILLDKNGKSIPVELNSNIVLYQGEPTTMVFIRDISERKKTEIALKESEDKYRTLSEQIPLGLYRTTNEGKFLYANPALAKILGYTSVAELLAVNVNDLFFDLTKRNNQIKRLIREKEYFSDESQLIRKDGKVIWVRENSQTKFNEKGEVEYFYGVIENITEQKEIDEALQKSEANLRAMLNAIPDILFKFNKKGVFLDAYSFNQEDLVLAPEEILGKSISDFFPLEFTNIALMQIEQCIVSGKLHTFEFSIPIKGEIRFYETRLAPINSEVVLSLLRDITARKKAEEKVELLVKAINNVHECISITDLDDRIIYLNPAFLSTYGYAEEELIGKPIAFVRDPDTPESLLNEIYNQSLKGGWNGELINIKRDGSRFPIFVSTSVLTNEKGEPVNFIGVSNDISQRKKAEQELIQAKEKAEESDRLKTAFLANMSHEIRSPMNAVLGFVQLLKEEEVLSENGNQYISLIIKSGTHLISVIEDIIDISKIQANQLRLSQSEFDLNNLLSDLFISFNSILKNQPESRVVLNPPLLHNPSPFIINSDEVRIRQIMTNLLSNAMKFTSKGYIKFGYNILTENNKQYLQFFVQDTGIGMSHEKHQLIFERFRQADDSFTRIYGGSGLGLAISKGLVDLLGGKIWVESEENKGATFFVSLPLDSFLTTSYNLYTNQENILYKKWEVDWSTKTILIVEDMIEIQFFLQRVLDKTKVKILLASNIKEAKELYHTRKDIDLIILDIRLPDGDGYDLAREFKLARPHIPIIIETAYAMEGEQQKSFDAGCDDFITKPINANLLLTKIGHFFKMD